ncbi:MAG: SGNH/GDSL hydrolase family protein [Victivallaceae bacterium]|nr:SGNH/GDSL hydrolase family protein [Victivallaceae bacterium]
MKIPMANSFESSVPALPDGERYLKTAAKTSKIPENLHNFFLRAEKGEHLTIGVFGGSITEGAICKDRNDSWSYVLLRKLERRYPKSTFTLINAGIGATGSDYGMLRLERDLLCHKVDLVMLDFAVNDFAGKGGTPATYEACVRQILRAENHPPLILIFMCFESMESEQESQMRIGRHYGLAMLSYQDALAAALQENQFHWSDIAADRVHPNENGHRFLAELLDCFFQSAAQCADPVPESALPAALHDRIFSIGKILPPESLAVHFNSGWKFHEELSGMPRGWSGCLPGDEFYFSVAARSIFLVFWAIKGASGRVSVTVDEGIPVELDSYFPEDWGGKKYVRPVACNLPDGEHRVKIRILSDRHPQSTGHNFTLCEVGLAD